MEVIASTTRLSDILHRNLPGRGQQYYLSMTRDEKKLLDVNRRGDHPGAPDRQCCGGRHMNPRLQDSPSPRRCVPAAGCVVPDAVDRAGRAPLG